MRKFAGRVMGAVVSTTILAACAAPNTPGKDSPAVGKPNPASVYCAALGGKSEMVSGAGGGQQRMCHLPDGSVMEEWALYRRDHP